MRNIKVLLALVVVALIAAFFIFDLGQYLSIEFLKSRHQVLVDYAAENKVIALGGFFLLYVAVAALSLPGAALLTLAGGAIFGFITGLILVSFASTIGATLAFLFSRFMFRDAVQKKFSSHLQTINDGMKEEGAFYLFTLRLIPVVPFFVVNLLMGLSTIKTLVFAWVSQLGMLPGTAVFVNAGNQLAQIDTLKDILSPSLLAAFALLGIFPIVAKKLIALYKKRKSPVAHTPSSFDTNIIVIGAGSGGLIAALIAAAVKAKVTLIEKHQMGGDCLNTGCVPSKALIKSARFMYDIKLSLIHIPSPRD